MATRIVTPTTTDPKKPLNESFGDVRSELFDIVALIHAGFDLADDHNLVDIEGLTGPDTRRDSLLIMARDKAAAAISALNQLEREVQHG